MHTARKELPPVQSAPQAGGLAQWLGLRGLGTQATAVCAASLALLLPDQASRGQGYRFCLGRLCGM